MKCMANQDESVVVRVSEEKAKILQEEGFHFIPKEVWKKKVRDAEQPVEDKPIKYKHRPSFFCTDNFSSFATSGNVNHSGISSPFLNFSRN